jgi:hypothetical protein
MIDDVIVDTRGYLGVLIYGVHRGGKCHGGYDWRASTVKGGLAGVEDIASHVVVWTWLAGLS